MFLTASGLKVTFETL